MFERPITFRHGDGSTSAGRVDCYRAATLSGKARNSRRASRAADRRHHQGLRRRPAARPPAGRGLRPRAAGQRRPPALRGGGGRGPRHRALRRVHPQRRHLHPVPRPAQPPHPPDQLADPAVRAGCGAVDRPAQPGPGAHQRQGHPPRWPPKLAELAKSLEAAGHPPQQVAAFLTRCLFSMFAEDVGLLPRPGTPGAGQLRPPAAYLPRTARHPGADAAVLWQDMDAAASTPPSAKTCCASTASCSRAPPPTATCCR
jgi:hypothetical protein